MNELFDKLILRIIFSIFICIILFVYKYAHSILYPSSRSQLFKNFYPSQNPAETLHFFSRIIGIGVIFSALYFDMEDGLAYSLLGFFIQGTASFILYLISIYILESITLFNFEYIDEIVKRKNLCYSVISFTQAIGLAFIINTILQGARSSLIMLLFLWLFAIVLLGFSTKFFKLISTLSFNKLMIQKNLALAFSFSGHLFGSTVIIISAMKQKQVSIESYTIQVLLKILLSAIIFPIFRNGLIFIFKLKDDLHLKHGATGIPSSEAAGPNFAYGLYEGSLLFTSAFLTSIITGHILFGNFYPLF